VIQTPFKRFAPNTGPDFAPGYHSLFLTRSFAVSAPYGLQDLTCHNRFAARLSLPFAHRELTNRWCFATFSLSLADTRSSYRPLLSLLCGRRGRRSSSQGTSQGHPSGAGFLIEKGRAKWSHKTPYLLPISSIVHTPFPLVLRVFGTHPGRAVSVEVSLVTPPYPFFTLTGTILFNPNTFF